MTGALRAPRAIELTMTDDELCPPLQPGFHPVGGGGGQKKRERKKKRGKGEREIINPYQCLIGGGVTVRETATPTSPPNISFWMKPWQPLILFSGLLSVQC